MFLSKLKQVSFLILLLFAFCKVIAPAYACASGVCAGEIMSDEHKDCSDNSNKDHKHESKDECANHICHSHHLNGTFRSTTFEFVGILIGIQIFPACQDIFYNADINPSIKPPIA